MNKSEKVYSYLKKKILSGDLRPGASIKLNQVAEELSVSKSPVREAIRRLEAEGLIDVIYNSGARVKDVDLKELEQIVLIRQRIECLAIGLAAKNIDSDKIRILRKMVEEMEECVKQNDKDKYSSINRDFHMIIYRASNADVIANLIEDLWNRSERTTMVFNMFPDRFLTSNSEHVKMVDCLENHDSIGAEEILHKQKEDGFIHVIRILKEYENFKNC